MRSTKANLVLATGILLLSACGGGGGGGSGSSTPVEEQGFIDPPIDPIPDPVPEPSQGDLSNLLGDLTLTYQFTGGTNIFETSARFSNASFSTADSGRVSLVTSNNVTSISCFVLDSGVYDYSCVTVSSTNGTSVTSMRIFLFNLNSNNGIGTGIFEFCANDELDIDVCIDELIGNPDGSLIVTVDQSSLAKTAIFSLLNDQPIDNAAFIDFHRADKLQKDGVNYSIDSVDTQPQVLARQLQSSHMSLIKKLHKH